MFNHISPSIIERASKIQLLICDVDGVLTDGNIYMGNQGEELKAFHVRDGYGIHCLHNIGIDVALITGRTSKIVEDRAKTLKINWIYQGQSNKLLAFIDLINNLKLQKENIAYIGDDLIDASVMQQVGLAVAVADAHPLLLNYSHHQTQLSGGKGAVREVCDLILFSQHKLFLAEGLAV